MLFVPGPQRHHPEKDNWNADQTNGEQRNRPRLVAGCNRLVNIDLAADGITLTVMASDLA
jgi:hypothetical protein